MRSLARVVLAVVVAAAGPVLSACSSFDLDSIGEIWDSKKKLAGERKPVFPEGVPGVTSGVPPELVKGYHEPEGGAADPAKVAAEAAAGADAKPKKPPPQRIASKPKPKPKPADTPAPATQPQPAQAQGGWPAAQPQAAWPSSR
jgi:hypothetical protein